jgi:hypothetical protein
MPEFLKFKRVIQELRPSYPLLLCGIGSNGDIPERKLLTKTHERRIGERPIERHKASRSNTGSTLNEEWGVGARHALYHKQGVFYMPLELFPGAYFDQNGYILFRTEHEFKNCPHLRIGKRVNVRGGISRIPGYRKIL